MNANWSRSLALVLCTSAFAFAAACGGSKATTPNGTSGGSSSGGTTGGTTGGGSTGGILTKGDAGEDAGFDAGFDAGQDAGPACTDDCSLDGGTVCTLLDGGAALGSCERGSDGCLHVTGATACPSSLQRCPLDGGTACECPAPAACAPGSSACADGGVVDCALDVTGGCPVATTTSCAADQLCGSVDGGLDAGAAFACVCNDQCPAPGDVCTDSSHTATCSADSNGCLVVGTPTACAAPEICQAAATPANSCACPPASTTPGANVGCSATGATACGADGNIWSCGVASGGTGCLVWSIGTTCVGGYTCGGAAGSLGCNCPVNNGDSAVYVDPTAGNDGTFTNGSVTESPTGVVTPAACRFKTLAHAFGVVVSGGKVIATGHSSAQVQFTEPGESFPITVPANVTLTTSDSPLTTTNYALVFNDAAATDAVILSAGATLSGFSVVDNGGNSAARAIACASGAATLDTDLVNGLNGVSGGTNLTTGVEVSGSCALTTSGVTVENFTSAGVSLDQTTDAGTPAITTTNGAVGPNGKDGLVVNAGAATLTGTHFDGNGATNSVSSGIALNGGTLTASSITASKNQGTGVYVGAAATSASLTGATASINGYDGLLAQGGTIALATVTANANGHDGLDVTGGSVTDTGGVYGASGAGNTADGVALTESAALSFTGSGTSASGNGANGVNLLPGNGTPVAATVALHGVTLSGNVARGLYLEAGLATPATGGTTMVTVDGTGGATSVGGNGTGNTKMAGVRVASGSLTMSGASGAPVTISGNGAAGVRITYGSNSDFQATTLSGVTVGGAAASAANAVGIDINSGGSPIEVNGCTIEGNAGDGILVEKSPTDASSKASVIVEDLSGSRTTVTANGGVGIDVTGSAGNVVAVIRNTTVSLNHNAGILLDQSTGAGATNTTATLTGNEVAQNNQINDSASGGVVIKGSIDLAGFTGNLLYGNGGDQMVVAAVAPATATKNCSTATCWDLAEGTCGSSNNTFTCYSTFGIGLRAAGGTVGLPININADNNAWADAPPNSTLDYGTANGSVSNISAANACAKSTQICP